MEKSNKRQSIARTGTSGTIGQVLVQEIGPYYDLISINHHNYPSNKFVSNSLSLNLLNTNKIQETLKQIHPDYLIHLAAITHIDNCEKDKQYGKNGIV